MSIIFACGPTGLVYTDNIILDLLNIARQRELNRGVHNVCVYCAYYEHISVNKKLSYQRVTDRQTVRQTDRIYDG